MLTTYAVGGVSYFCGLSELLPLGCLDYATAAKVLSSTLLLDWCVSSSKRNSVPIEVSERERAQRLSPAHKQSTSIEAVFLGRVDRIGLELATRTNAFFAWAKCRNEKTPPNLETPLYTGGQSLIRTGDLWISIEAPDTNVRKYAHKGVLNKVRNAIQGEKKPYTCAGLD